MESYDEKYRPLSLCSQETATKNQKEINSNREEVIRIIGDENAGNILGNIKEADQKDNNMYELNYTQAESEISNPRIREAAYEAKVGRAAGTVWEEVLRPAPAATVRFGFHGGGRKNRKKSKRKRKSTKRKRKSTKRKRKSTKRKRKSTKRKRKTRKQIKQKGGVLWTIVNNVFRYLNPFEYLMGAEQDPGKVNKDGLLETPVPPVPPSSQPPDAAEQRRQADIQADITSTYVIAGAAFGSGGSFKTPHKAYICSRSEANTSGSPLNNILYNSTPRRLKVFFNCNFASVNKAYFKDDDLKWEEGGVNANTTNVQILNNRGEDSGILELEDYIFLKIDTHKVHLNEIAEEYELANYFYEKKSGPKPIPVYRRNDQDGVLDTRQTASRGVGISSYSILDMYGEVYNQGRYAYVLTKVCNLEHTSKARMGWAARATHVQLTRHFEVIGELLQEMMYKHHFISTDLKPDNLCTTSHPINDTNYKGQIIDNDQPQFFDRRPFHPDFELSPGSGSPSDDQKEDMRAVGLFYMILQYITSYYDHNLNNFGIYKCDNTKTSAREPQFILNLVHVLKAATITSARLRALFGQDQVSLFDYINNKSVQDIMDIIDAIDSIIQVGKIGSGVLYDPDFPGSTNDPSKPRARLGCKRMYSHYVRMSDCRFPRNFPFGPPTTMPGGVPGGQGMRDGSEQADHNTLFSNNLKNSIRFVKWFFGVSAGSGQM